MKAKLSENKLILRKTQNILEEIETGILRIKNILVSVKNLSEDKNIDKFPYQMIQELVKQIENIKQVVIPIEVSDQFIKDIIEQKNVLEYFKQQINDIKNEEKTFLRKKELFKQFKTKLIETSNEFIDI